MKEMDLITQNLVHISTALALTSAELHHIKRHQTEKIITVLHKTTTIPKETKQQSYMYTIWRYI